MTTAYTLFETELGVAAIVWGDGGITRTLLPEQGAGATEALVCKLFPDGRPSLPSADIAKAVTDIAALIAGETPHLRDAPLDMVGLSPFAVAAYGALRAIGPGETITYGALAERIGAKGEARAIGVVLGRNPFPVIVPCHRVLAANGRLGGFSAPGGQATKLALLNREQARTSEAPGLFGAADLPLATRQS